MGCFIMKCFYCAFHLHASLQGTWIQEQLTDLRAWTMSQHIYTWTSSFPSRVSVYILYFGVTRIFWSGLDDALEKAASWINARWSIQPPPTGTALVHKQREVYWQLHDNKSYSGQTIAKKSVRILPSGVDACFHRTWEAYIRRLIASNIVYRH